MPTNPTPAEFKRWFNARYPYRRRCLKPWCWRGQVYQHRCPQHVKEVLSW